ncbi:MAG: hypothetical protein OEV93_00650 [Candidatus Moranbacteria bacterium]|nr:hypothetical protein [Candidatus Moranbacteria bacterium]
MMTTGTAIFWTIIIIIAIYAIRTTLIHADYCVRGYQKINGEWVPTMNPDHHTEISVFLAYVMGCGMALIALFFVSVAILDYSGIGERFAIDTLIHLMRR